MRKLSNSYSENVMQMDRLLRVDENFDMLKKIVKVGEDELTFYYLDGFVKDAVMQKMMVHFLSLKSLGERTDRSAQDFLFHNIPYVVEGDAVDDHPFARLAQNILLLLWLSEAGKHFDIDRECAHTALRGLIVL